MSLRDVVFGYPAIDNHAHPLLKEEHRQDLPFEGVISEAQSNAAKDAVHSLPGYRATRGSITVIEAQTGALYVPCMIKRRLSCFAFSQTAKELVCGVD